MNIAIYPSHDSNITVQLSPNNYRVFEFERYFKQRFCSLLNKSKEELDQVFQEIYVILTKDLKQDLQIDICYHLGLPELHQELLTKYFKVNQFIEVGHHLSHAACSFYQSSFEEALIISYDGGGLDFGEGDDRVTYFNIYHANRLTGKIERIANFKFDLGTAYGLTALPIKEIYKGDKWQDRFLSFAGKLMGLVAYGNVRDEWILAFENYYRRHKWVNENDLKILGEDLKLDLSVDSLSGQIAYDFAATSQKAFQEVIMECVLPIIGKIEYQNLPICLSGGCALNVLMNQWLKDYSSHQIFIPPNPSDCGLSFGMIALHEKPRQAIDLQYQGWPILDIDQLDKLPYQNLLKDSTISYSSLMRISTLLLEGYTIGVMHSNSEVGPRALGNRSILCDPRDAKVKDKLNNKIKFREWFRPFAPVVQADKVNKFFEFDGDASYMSFSPKVRLEYRDQLQGIVHQDGTARVQTITKEQNYFLYELLSWFETLTGFPILLNTSFNIKGLPILTTIEDAVKNWQETELNYLLIEDCLYGK